jgi:hypothetical protein
MEILNIAEVHARLETLRKQNIRKETGALIAQSV